MPLLPTERFTSRVDSYRLHRPGYPKGIVDLLGRECELKADSAIADIAAGTGLLTEIFLDQGYSVTAVEPNDAMRAACESLAAEYSKLRCVAGTAEATGLTDHSIDLLTVAQAMHWFDLDRTREEFRRVLKPSGWCAVIYNHRRMSGDSFHEGYETILRSFGTDYQKVQSSHLGGDQITAFFQPGAVQTAVFPNAQQLALEGLEGRVLSSSYMPQPGHARYTAMREAIEELYSREQKNGFVTMQYECAVSYGRINENTRQS